MTKCLIEDIFERFMSYRKDSKEVQNIERERFYNNYINKPMDRSYYSEFDDRKIISAGYLNLFSDILHDESKLLSLIDTQPKFVDDYIDKILVALNFKTTFNYPEKFRKLLMKNITKSLYMLMFKDEKDFDMFTEVMYKRIYQSNNEISHEEMKAKVLAEIWDTSNLTDNFPDAQLRTMSFKQIMDLMIDPFNVDKDMLIKQAKNDNYSFYSTFAKAVAHHLDRVMTDDNPALKEWESELSEEDKNFLGKMILEYKKRAGGGYESMDTIQYFIKFKSLDILEAYTFKLSSSSDWWKDKSILSNVFAVWYACRKGQVPKYVQNKFGKFKSLLSLYGYNWKKLKEIILKDKEVIEALS